MKQPEKNSAMVGRVLTARPEDSPYPQTSKARLLVLNLGNTSLFGGVFENGKLRRRFRVPTRQAVTTAGFARHVKPLLKGEISAVALASVVPAHTSALMFAVWHHLGVAAQLLTADAPHGLKIGYTHPRELGTDRLAAVLGARALFPQRNVIVVDGGTATTVTALDRQGSLLGGAILPGLALSAEVLATGTAQLPRVATGRPGRALGRSTQAGIASGVFYGQVGAIRELVARIRREAFGRASAVVIGTGGNAPLLGRENLFTRQEPDLILFGLRDFALRTSYHE
jgi:type III pantothenate kinase